jgi:UDP-N-acetyl-D-mannosaminuronic acid dehydrogenase
VNNHRNIVVIGMGYVGIPCAVLLANVPGHSVTGVQRRSERSGWKIDWLNSGRCPFCGHEPGLREMIATVVTQGSFSVTDDFGVCRDADVILVDVQTPVDGQYAPRYESLCDAIAQVGSYLQSGTLVIIESTVAPGTTQHVIQPILERESALKAGRDFLLAFSYERVMPGKLLEYIVSFPRVVGGINDQSTQQAVAFYRTIVNGDIAATDVLTAEMAKVVENAYRDVNIAFANEVALACESMGVDVFEIRDLINARPDRHMHLPGAGVGGHCLPKDPWLLQHGLHTYGRNSDVLRLVPLARKINDSMPSHMYDLIERELANNCKQLTGSKIAILGVSYLENSDDTRNTPAAPLTRLLIAGGASVVAHDPYVRISDWRRELGEGYHVLLTKDLDDALDGADCAVIVTKHHEYCDLAPDRLRSAMRTPIVVDGRNVFVKSEARAAGFAYLGVGNTA